MSRRDPFVLCIELGSALAVVAIEIMEFYRVNKLLAHAGFSFPVGLGR